nr:class I SAM-dependent methyltransferase [uncultured Sphingomonas sp.]
MTAQTFTPAAGRFVPTQFYDRGVALLTRENVWRRRLLQLLVPANGEAVLDVGCGTGSLAILIKQMAPGAHVVGIDPDPKALSLAKGKAENAGLEIEWQKGFASDAAQAGTFDKVVSSLVFHQVPLAEKRTGLAAMVSATKPGESLCIADYARQDRWSMRQSFRFIQLIDGKANTQLNAEGFLERELSVLCGRSVEARTAIDTPTGTISIFLEKIRAE